ncbi:MAG: UTRA domain-containing protein [Cellvibrionales bacterium]|nr:UTRA domain-containing protein [Cellvibrionales bacterium]
MAKPEWKKIVHHIVQAIKNKELLTNDKIPSENTLSNQYHVSRMTARKALDQLVNDGILFRIQGKGTYVSNISAITSTLEIKNIADEIKDRGHSHNIKIISLKQVEPPETIHPLFLSKELKPFYSLMIHFENELAIQVEERWVDNIAVPDYLSQDFTQQTPNHYLSAVAPLEKANHRIQAITAKASIANLLDISKGSPCLQIVRHSYSNNRLISFARLTHPADRFQLISGEFTTHSIPDNKHH